MTRAGRPYFVMELVRGLPITEYCDREELSIPERLELFTLVCRQELPLQPVAPVDRQGIADRRKSSGTLLPYVLLFTGLISHDGIPVTAGRPEIPVGRSLVYRLYMQL